MTIVAPPQATHDVKRAAQALANFMERHPRLVALTGAGVSTASGIPDYRDAQGQWKRPQPVTYQAFMGSEHTRQRYWARSLVGWRCFGQARPGVAHTVMAHLEQAGRLPLTITQNVDGLHQAAGAQSVVDLHGRLDTVRCMHCEARFSRVEWQQQLEHANPHFVHLQALSAPDGDADLEAVDFSRFLIPACPVCGAGPLKPDVVFYGESVPRARVQRSMEALAAADGLLVLGSSLMVYSGYRFALAACEQGKPVVALNLGVTRADEFLSLKFPLDVGATLQSTAALLHP